MGGLSSASESTVVVAVLTYRRPTHIVEILPMLVAQVAELPAGTSGRVVVVDNDPDASARERVAALRLPSVTYVHEPTPGIAAARNRALLEAGEADALVFIDDDGRPRPGWLVAHVDAWRRYDAQAVAGRVIPHFQTPVEPWVLAGDFFDRRDLPTGTVVAIAATSTLLIDLRFVRAHGLRFDPRTGLSGGEDTLFTRQITGLGGKIVFCSEGAIDDLIPVNRTSRRWVLQRSLSHGNTQALLDAGFPHELAGLTTRARVAGHGVARVGVGIGRVALGTITRDHTHSARGARLVARGTGMLIGAGGRVYQEYARPDADGRTRRLTTVSSGRRASAPALGPGANATSKAAGTAPSAPASRPAGTQPDCPPGAPRSPRLRQVALQVASRPVAAITSVRTQAPVLALTFDDGPDPEVTPALLDVLARHGARATFFVLAGRAQRHPEIVRRIVDEGHELALHGADHRRLTAIPPAAARASLLRGRDLLADAAGVQVGLFRPPYGAQSWSTLLSLRAAGLTGVLWSATLRDWADVSTAERLALAVRARHGDIVLAHDGRADASDGAEEAADLTDLTVDKPALIDAVLTGWTARGLRSVTVSELIANGTPWRHPVRPRREDLGRLASASWRRTPGR